MKHVLADSAREQYPEALVTSYLFQGGGRRLISGIARGPGFQLISH